MQGETGSSLAGLTIQGRTTNWMLRIARVDKPPKPAGSKKGTKIARVWEVLAVNGVPLRCDVTLRQLGEAMPSRTRAIRLWATLVPCKGG